MALIYPAQLNPGKLEAIAAWLPGQPWSAVGSAVATGAEVERVSSYRFDDPAGDVGVEIHLVRVVGDDAVIQVPLTYRGAPLAGAEAHLVTEMDHSVLGARWVYDAAADPVYIAEVLRAIRAEGANAQEIIRTADGDVENTDVASVRGVLQNASAVEALEVDTRAAVGISAPATVDGITVVRAGDLELEIVRFPLNGTPSAQADVGRQSGTGPEVPAAEGEVLGLLSGSWVGQDQVAELVRLRRTNPAST